MAAGATEAALGAAAAEFRRLEAELRIRDLVSQYAHRYDSRDLEGWLALFEDDAVWSSLRPSRKVDQRYEGKEAMRLRFRTRFEEIQNAGEQHRHHQTNILLQLEDGGGFGGGVVEAASGRVYVVITGYSDGHLVTGVYHDVYKRTAGEGGRGGAWRFAARELHLDRVVRPKAAAAVAAAKL